MRDDWIIYAIFGVLVCLLLWRVATQWKVKSTEAENLRVSVVIVGVVALVFLVWQYVQQASPIAAHSQDKTITVFAAASMKNAHHLSGSGDGERQAGDPPISGVSAVCGDQIDVRGLRLLGASKAHILNLRAIEDVAH